MKIKGNITSDGYVGACESAFKIKKRPRAPKELKEKKLNHVKKNMVYIKKHKKTKGRGDGAMIEEPCHEDEHIIEVIDSKDCQRLLFKAKSMKIKGNRTSDGSVGACESAFNIKKRPRAPKELKKIKLNHVKKNMVYIKKHKKTKGTGDGAMIEEPCHEDEHIIEVIDSGRLTNVNKWKGSIEFQTLNEVDSYVHPKTTAIEAKIKTKNLKKDHKHKNKSHNINVTKSCTGETQSAIGEEMSDEISLVDEDSTRRIKTGRLVNVDNWEGSTEFQTLNEVDSYVEPKAAASEPNIKTKKLKKDHKHKNKSHDINATKSCIEETRRAISEERVDEISLVDEDCTRGVKKWLMQYKERRPGIKVLQQRIDEFVTAHEELQDEERKEREARAAEDGWTVVVHHKGRKRTTDAETGTPMGSVALAAVTEKMSKKKSKEIGLDFYRFQKREAKMNELMMLQSKFEQDKKRIQQLRAARKFRPY